MIDNFFKKTMNAELDTMFCNLQKSYDKFNMAIELLEKRLNVHLNDECREHVKKWVEVHCDNDEYDLFNKLNYQFMQWAEQELSKKENRRRIHYYAYHMFFMSKIVDAIETLTEDSYPSIDGLNLKVNLDELEDFVIENLDTQLQNDLESDVEECVEIFLENKRLEGGLK
jgi:hypothetical protein